MIKGLNLKYTEEDIQKAYKQGIENGKYEAKKEFKMYDITVVEENKEVLQKEFNKGFEKGSDYVREYIKQNESLQNQREEDIQKLSFNDGYRVGKKEGYKDGNSGKIEGIWLHKDDEDFVVSFVKDSGEGIWATVLSEPKESVTGYFNFVYKKGVLGYFTKSNFLNCFVKQEESVLDKQLEKELALVEKYPHYYKDIRHLSILDIYRFFDLFEVTDPCIQHSLKKMAVGGKRGSKDYEKDIKEAVDTLSRWEYMQEENKRGVND